MSRARLSIVVIALLLLNYVGGYFALSDPSLSGIDMGGGGIHRMKPRYRVGGGVARAVYWPLEMIDRQVRPAFWSPRVHSCVILVYEVDAELRDMESRE